MSEDTAQVFRYRRTQASQGIWYGSKPNANLYQTTNVFALLMEAGICAVFAGVVIFLLAYFLHQGTHSSTIFAKYATVVGFLWRIFLPYVSLLWGAVKQQRLPNFHRWQTFTGTEKITANIALALFLTFAINDSYAWLVAHHELAPLPLISTTMPNNFNKENEMLRHHPYHHAPITAKTMPIELNTHAWFLLWGVLGLLFCTLTHRLEKKAKPLTDKQKYLSHRKAQTLAKALPFGLWLGESTGRLSRLSHGVGIAPHQQVALFGDDAAQNILILGATGSGKTTRAINPLLLQLLEQQCGGLIFDIKGDFHQTVEALSQKTDSSYTVIGAQDKPFNLLAGLTPEIAASFLKSALLLNGGHRQDNFWVDTATELCRHVLGVLSFLPEHYSLHGLYCYLFDKAWRHQCNEDIAALLLTLDDKEQRLLASYQHYYDVIFNDFDDKVQGGVKATVAQVLSPFNHPELIDAFCTAHPNSIRLEDVLSGQVFLVNMPLSRWGLGGKVVYTFIKLRLFNIMQRRTSQPEWNQDRFVFLLCDEYQEVVSANKEGLSDLNFWDKSRSSKTIGIVSTQSVSSFYAAIGDRDMANAVLQNFRQKLCFRTEDETTIAMMNRLLGMVEIQRVTRSQNSGSSKSWQNRSSHQGESTSISTHDKPLLDGQFFRTLPANHTLALLSLSGNGCDDVLKMEPLFL